MALTSPPGPPAPPRLGAEADPGPGDRVPGDHAVEARATDPAGNVGADAAGRDHWVGDLARAVHLVGRGRAVARFP